MHAKSQVNRTLARSLARSFGILSDRRVWRVRIGLGGTAWVLAVIRRAK